MKYVSPICELEAFETEDIMAVSANTPLVNYSGNKDALMSDGTYTFDAETGDKVEPGQGNGVSVAVDFNKLFSGTSNT